MAAAKGNQVKRKQLQTQRAPLTPAKAALFPLITLSLPFVVVAALEVGLRLGNYGGDMLAFDTPPILKGMYKVPSERLGKRYFPREKFPPAPPGDPFLVAKPAHSMRIFVLGESSAAGFPYSANGTFSRVLRDALTDVLPSDTVEIVTWEWQRRTVTRLPMSRAM